MKRLLSILLFITLSFLLFAQAPEWLWAESAGGNNYDGGSGISTDGDGNVYVTGNFSGTASFGSFNLTSSGSSDIFVAKMDANGNWLWVENAGGSSDDCGFGISTDVDGNVYITGYFDYSANFGSFNLTSNGAYDIFVAKMDPNGNWLWAESAGGSDLEYGIAICTDSNGNVYVTGIFEGTASFGSFDLPSNGDDDIFVAKMDPNGNWLWAKNAGGSEYDGGSGISTDADGNLYVTGSFRGTGSFGSFNLTSSGDHDIFVAKMDPNGNWLWVESAGGSYGDIGKAINTDADGNVYVTGYFDYLANFGSYNLTSNGVSDIFVAKMDPNGNWIWAKNAGGSEYDGGSGISTDIDENVYVSGYFHGTASFGSFNLTSSGERDIFVTKMDSNGNWIWAESAGGSTYDNGFAISTDAEGNVYVTGYYRGIASFGSFNLTSSGNSDIFVAKIDNITSIEDEIITTINVLTNYPNPFNPTTTISFSIHEESEVELSIYNIKGQKIKSLLNDQIPTGEHSIIWNGDDDFGNSVSSGVYLYKLNVNGKTEVVKKCLLLK